mmetsp:Transcript_10461/g.19582  ORF Transcript_10461/g.19582 Transcript_10461/m.19582 type:complete len:201 (-) Transcript_10461:166-768(-)
MSPRFSSSSSSWSSCLFVFSISEDLSPSCLSQPSSVVAFSCCKSLSRRFHLSESALHERFVSELCVSASKNLTTNLSSVSCKNRTIVGQSSSSKCSSTTCKAREPRNQSKSTADLFLKSTMTSSNTSSQSKPSTRLNSVFNFLPVSLSHSPFGDLGLLRFGEGGTLGAATADVFVSATRSQSSLAISLGRVIFGATYSTT